MDVTCPKVTPSRVQVGVDMLGDLVLASRLEVIDADGAPSPDDVGVLPSRQVKRERAVERGMRHQWRSAAAIAAVATRRAQDHH